MRRALRTVLVFVVLPLGAVSIVYVLGIRSKSSIVRDAARRFHHTVGNRFQMRRAGMRGTRASVLRHRGRTTGRTYETPLWAAPTEDGFVIGIVYGSRTDWLQNVLAGGEATIVHEGESYAVDEPEIVPMDTVRTYFPAMTRRLQGPVRVDRCLRLHRADVAEPPSRGAAPRRDRRPEGRDVKGAT